MYHEVIHAIPLLLVVTFIHAEATLIALRWARRSGDPDTARLRRSAAYRIVRVVLLMFFAHLLETFVWALAYIGFGAIDDMETAMYFSVVTYTTLGYGDVVLDEQWRLFGGFEAFAGIVMFGWTTAVVMAVVQRVLYAGGGEVSS